ncbi:hypothetical protein LCGC14_1756410 [marine sediment metagenome]|uniref:DUF1937 domain-containing protein n=1 Tax=marine sediment metagenome TaxID=412755 RepID=A0A0F9H2D8_9ZZZZ
MVELIYLASPYDDPDPALRAYRYIEVRNAAISLITSELFVFSPILHCHPIAQYGGLPTDFTFWEYFDKKMISVADRFGILELFGWKNSRGINREVEIALDHNLIIESINPITYQIEK